MESSITVPTDIWFILFYHLINDVKSQFIPPRHCATHLYLLSTAERRAFQAYKKIKKLKECAVYTLLPPLLDTDKFLMFVTQNEATQYEGQYGRKYVVDTRGRRKYVETLESVGKNRNPPHFPPSKRKWVTVIRNH
jgi:hypothetical protein